MNQKEKSSSPNNELNQKQADEIFEIFRNIKKGIACKFERCSKEYGFTAPQLGVIFHLYKIRSTTLNDLSEHMYLTKSTVSGIIDRLAKQGVVIREIPEDNRRTVKLSLSEEFKKNNDIALIKEKFICEVVLNSLQKMNQEEIEKMIYGLRQFSILINDDVN